MTSALKSTAAIFAAGFWISLSEFVRNEFLFKTSWISHYESLGLSFPDAPINGALWGLWSMLFALIIFMVSRRFSLWETLGISWLAGFILMWIVTGNMMVLPLKILVYAVPLSILETGVAALIILKISHPTHHR